MHFLLNLKNNNIMNNYMSKQIMQSLIQAVSDGELKLVSFADCGRLDFIGAHHHFNITGDQAPRPLACADLASQLNFLIYI